MGKEELIQALTTIIEHSMNVYEISIRKGFNDSQAFELAKEFFVNMVLRK